QHVDVERPGGGEVGHHELHRGAPHDVGRRRRGSRHRVRADDRRLLRDGEARGGGHGLVVRGHVRRPCVSTTTAAQRVTGPAGATASEPCSDLPKVGLWTLPSVTCTACWWV